MIRIPFLPIGTWLFVIAHLNHLNHQNTVVLGFSPVSRATPFIHKQHNEGNSLISSTAMNMRVAYQGEPGAYSEKSTRELLGPNVIALGKPDFESCFQAVASMEVDYACLPVENSLGGSIHENYDLMLRYDLTICAEHEFRVQHCLLAMDGVKRDDLKFAISHPQALAQCDNYLRSLGITPIPTYDTAGSAKMISENRLPDGCSQENTCAIASDLAGETYNMNCLAKGIEDDDTNFTRFLLLGRKGIAQYLSKKIPAKTSVVFTLPNAAGALYKALACFSLRDIDCSKIESRPTSASLLNYLKFRSKQNGSKSRQESANLPRFRYTFYLDFLAGQLDENTENALAHLREQADYLRVLGSYPQRSRLVGPVAKAAEELKSSSVDYSDPSLVSLPDAFDETKSLNIGIVGFGAFGKFLAKKFQKKHKVSCMDSVDKSSDARQMDIDFFAHFDSTNFLRDLDVVVMSVPLLSLEDAVQALPLDLLRGKLVVDVSPVNGHPKETMLRAFQNSPDIDILCTNPMFGPSNESESTDDSSGLDGRSMVYEKVRVNNVPRCDKFLGIFEQARCNLVEMDSLQHDSTTADAEFVTHLVGRLLDQKLLPATPVMSSEYEDLCNLADMTAEDSFDLFFGMYKFNPRARDHLASMRENLASIERQLAAREAYLGAQAEMKQSDRQRLLSETRLLLQELAKSGGLGEVLEAEKEVASQPQSLGEEGEASNEQ